LKWRKREENNEEIDNSKNIIDKNFTNMRVNIPFDDISIYNIKDLLYVSCFVEW